MGKKLKTKSPKRNIRADSLKVVWEKAVKLFEPEKESLFQQLEKKIGEYPYVKEILTILAAGTFLSACLVMPGLPRILKPFIWQEKGYRRKRLGQVLKRMRKQKLVEITEIEGTPVVRITQKGMTRALSFKLEEMKIKKPKAWDKKWRMVVFDIPEKLKTLREIFRDRLKSLGFFRLQDSVFIHPYPCFDEIEFLRQLYGVEIGVTYILAERVEGQESLKDHFSLQ